MAQKAGLESVAYQIRAPTSEIEVEKEKMRKKQLPLAIATFALSSVLLAAPVRADRRDFPFTYQWSQAPKGSAEFEVKNTYNGEENAFRQEFEVEYGLTDRLLPYLIAENAPGDKYHFQGFKIESRYRLGDFKRNTILPTLYLEYADEKGEPRELEGKLILSRYGKDGSNFSFNYIVERELQGGADFENVYSFGYARRLSKKGVRGGFEWIHNLSDGRLKAGPVLSLRAGNNIFISSGYAFNLNRRNGNRPEARINVEYEF